MHLILLTTLLAASSKTSSTTKAAGAGGSSFFFLILLALVVVYFFVLRPRQRRARQQQGSRGNLQVGDEVISAGGILGRIVAIEGDEIVVEVAPGMNMTFWRRAVNLRTSVSGAPPGTTMAPPEPDHDEDLDGYGVDHRYDDGEDGGGSEPSGHFGTAEDADGAAGEADADESDGAGAPGDGPPQPIYDPGAAPDDDPWGSAPPGEGGDSPRGTSEGR